MATLKRILLTTAAAFSAAGFAHAADPIEIDVSGSASVVAGVSDGDADADANAEVAVTGSTLLDNGVEIGAVVEARLDADQPRQYYAGGRYSSLLIGGPRGIAPLDSDAYLQGAYAYARGGFGQVIVGRDHGVARTLAVTSPTIFRAINVNDWQTDLSGLNDINTVNDFSGYATKITYMPPPNMFGGVLGGLQVGVSYSPELQNCGERLCAPQSQLIITPDGALLNETSTWQDGIEGAIYYQKGIKLGGDRLLLGVGASYLSADEDVRVESEYFDDYEAYSVGLNLAYRGITLGGSVKTTNSGLAETDDDDGYLAFDAGVTFQTGEEAGDWGLMFGYGRSEATMIGPNPLDPTLFTDTQTAQAGVNYVIGRGVTVGAAAQYVESKKPAVAGGPEEAATVVIESSIRF